MTSLDEWTYTPTANDDAWSDEEPALLYPNLVDWVTEWLVPMYRRNMELRDYAWCPEWWRHPEAVVRLSALWRGFEQHRRDPGDSMSTWLRDHLDHHIPLLIDADRGPLKGCSAAKGHSARSLVPMPLTAPPPALPHFLT